MKTMSAGDAKARFGQLLEAAASGPVAIEKHGRPVAVLLSREEFEELQALRAQQFGALLQEGLDDLDQGRFVELGEAELDALLAGVKARARRTATGS